MCVCVWRGDGDITVGEAYEWMRLGGEVECVRHGREGVQQSSSVDVDVIPRTAQMGVVGELDG